MLVGEETQDIWADGGPSGWKDIIRRFLNMEYKYLLKRVALSAFLSVPAVGWLKQYNIRSLIGDVFAGCTVGMLVIPQGMAYALLAGLPAQYGLYTGLFPALGYVLTGVSPHLIVGPTAVLSLLTRSTIEELDNGSDSVDVARLVQVTFLVGLVQFLLGLLRFGFVVDFLPRSVVAGFTTAAGLLIALTQIPAILGIHVDSDDLSVFWRGLYAIGASVVGTNLWSLLIGVLSVAFLYVGRMHRYLRIVPWPLLLMVMSIAISWIFDLQSKMGLETLGNVPGGFVTPVIPFWDAWPRGSDWLFLVQHVPILCFVAVVEATAISRTFQLRMHYTVTGNQDLIALGISNLFGSFFRCYPATGSFSRTAVNATAGAKSPLSGLFGALLVALALLLLMPLVDHLPKVTLAAVILPAVLSLVDIHEFLELGRVHLPDLLVALVTFLATLAVGTEYGLVVGLVFSVLIRYYEDSDLLLRVRTKEADWTDEESKVPSENDSAVDMPILAASHVPKSSEQHLDGVSLEILPLARVLEIRPHGSLSFLNANLFSTRLRQAASWRDSPPEASGHLKPIVPLGFWVRWPEDSSEAASLLSWRHLRCLTVDFSYVNHVDTAAACTLATVCNELRDRGFTVRLVHAIPFQVSPALISAGAI